MPFFQNLPTNGATPTQDLTQRLTNSTVILPETRAFSRGKAKGGKITVELAQSARETSGQRVRGGLVRGAGRLDLAAVA